MADQNVLNAQIYLNSMYGHHSSWITLEEDGYTGILLLEGIIRAFQIQNDIESPTGTFGPATLEKIKSLDDLSKMNATDPINYNVCLAQCALFAKGYWAGGITGIYYTNGVNAINQLQEDAGLEVTGIIDWKTWYCLLSLYWYTLSSGGDSSLRIIQQQLNSDYSEYVGVGPCDGVIQRTTVLTILAGLQLELGVLSKTWISDLNLLNFGPITETSFDEVFPDQLYVGIVSEIGIACTKLLQYALKLNGFDPILYNGTYDYLTFTCVQNFQVFAKLNISSNVTLGKVNSTTMHSLIDSKGDSERTAYACDCSTVLNEQQAIDIKNAGYTHVGRYLTGSVGNDFIPKFITLEEISNIEQAGLSIFPIYQDGGWTLDYFSNELQGFEDAHTAIKAAESIGIPSETTIYFAVDFDCYSYQIDDYIIPYFQKIKQVFISSSDNPKLYKVGVYAPRYVCTKLHEENLTENSFVAGMSTKFSCNLGYPLPENWAFDQFYEFSGIDDVPLFTSSPSFALDKVAYSERDTGITNFDDVTYLSPDELEEAREISLQDVYRDRYIYNILSPLGYLDAFLGIKMEYDQEILLNSYFTTQFIIRAFLKFTHNVTISGEYEFIDILLNDDNSLSIETESALKNIFSEIALEMEDENIDGTVAIEEMKLIAISMGQGKIGFKLEPNDSDTAVRFCMVFTTDDFAPNSDYVNNELSCELIFELTPLNNADFDYENIEEFVLVSSAILLIAYCLLGGAGVAIETLVSCLTAYFEKLGYLIFF